MNIKDYQALSIVLAMLILALLFLGYTQAAYGALGGQIIVTAFDTYRLLRDHGNS